MTQTYAIVETGGQQYKVAPGDKIDVAYLAAGKGKEVELSKVLLIADGKDVVIGTPTIESARVTATCLAEAKGDKIIVLRYKSKTRRHRKTGHRQLYTTLKINDIVNSGTVVEAKAPRKRKAKAKAEAGGED